MIVELRSVPDCPHLPATRALLRSCLAELGLPLSFTEVVGEYPSPTVLVEGVDVMGGAGEEQAACRLDLPTRQDIRAALCAAMADRAPSRRRDFGVSAVPAESQCGTGPGDAIRADRPERAAQLSEGLRQVHRGVLRYFAATGGAPAAADLAAVSQSAGLDPATALQELAAVDLVAVDGDGQLVAAYPFSPSPTQHEVRWAEAGGYAMCAIDDALGMPYMLGVDATISSMDPQTVQPVTGGVAEFIPATTLLTTCFSELCRTYR
ncbi:organomercurial lyase [Streptomyces sp. H27-D2]|uniref:organomercurial lyase n=1 Tax=Streptomyces sp. H27-D2 TaxID=3046304 RepID=UPI002DBE4B0C|nr:organomercurial lyase [Streptomyces sp. H27-D2]MEC4017102.1 organomercurial lyase [Streptomyces sp. H27-D2]